MKKAAIIGMGVLLTVALSTTAFARPDGRRDGKKDRSPRVVVSLGADLGTSHLGYRSGGYGSGYWAGDHSWRYYPGRSGWAHRKNFTRRYRPLRTGISFRVGDVYIHWEQADGRYRYCDRDHRQDRHRDQSRYRDRDHRDRDDDRRQDRPRYH